MQVLVGISAGLALYFILADVWGLPTVKASRAIYSLSKNQSKGTGSLELGIHKMALFLSKWVRVNEYKRLQLAADLQTAGLNISPELHLAKGLVMGLITGLLAVPFFFIFPLIAPVFLIMAVMMYFRETGSLVALRLNMDHFTKELMAEGSVKGRLSQNIIDRQEELRAEMDLPPMETQWDAVYFDPAQKTVQLGEKMELTVTCRTTFQGFGIVSVPITLTARHSGLSQRYWK